MNPPGCKKCDSTNCFINRFTSDEWKQTIDKKRITVRLKKGDSLFKEGDPVSGIYFIYSGKFKVFNSGVKEKSQIVRLAKTGEIIGHRGFGKLMVYPIGATSYTPAAVCFIPEKMFREALKSNGELVFELMNFYADELRRAEYKLRSISQMTARQKMAEALLTVQEIFGIETIDDKEYIAIQLPRQDYADITGLSLEEVIRTLSAFNKQQLITISGKRICIENSENLKALLTEFGPLRIP